MLINSIEGAPEERVGVRDHRLEVGEAHYLFPGRLAEKQPVGDSLGVHVREAFGVKILDEYGSEGLVQLVERTVFASRAKTVGPGLACACEA